MRQNQLFVLSCSLAVCVACGLFVWSEGSRAVAQTSGSKSKLKSGTSKTKSSGDSKELDSRADDNLKTFLTETVKLAEDYEKAGKFEEAQEQLKSVSKLKPDLPGLKERIEKLNESLFESNELESELDVKESWKSQVLIFKGKPVRVDAVGDYTIIFNMKTDASGLSTKDPKTDMASGVRCGALMGIVVAVPEPGAKSARNDKDKDKIGEPFEIGTSKEFTPKEDGVLLLNVNLPSGHKSTGKLRVRVSGHIKPE